MGLMQQMFSGIPTTAGAPIPPYTADSLFNYVSLLLSGDTTSSTFISDASTNNLSLSPIGSVRNDNFSPFQGDGYYGVQFNGTSDYLTVAANSATTLGQTDATVEFWIYPTAQDGYRRIVSSTNGGFTAGTFVIRYSSGSFLAGAAGMSSAIIWNGYPPLNTWSHVAWVGVGGTSQTLYVNGVSVGTAAAYNITEAIQYIGGYYNVGPAEYFAGYISNLRVIKGTALYTANFAVPTSPLTAITNTSLLTCQSARFKDNSTNNLTIASTGTPKISYNQPISSAGKSPTEPITLPATYGSGYFNGSTDHLTIASNSAFNLGTGDFTLEWWQNIEDFSVTRYPITRQSSASGWNNIQWYATITTTNTFVLSVSSGSGVMNFFATSAGVFTLNTWQHVAIVRDTGTWKMFLNGVSLPLANGTAYTQSMELNGISQPLQIGGFVGWGLIKGYLSNLRLVKGTAVYTANFTPPTAPLTAIANTALLTLQQPAPATNNGFIDSSQFDFSITRTGTPTQGTLSPFSQTGWSAYFAGAQYLTTSSSANMTVGTGDFTIECWASHNAFSSAGNCLFDYPAQATYTSASVALFVYADKIGVYRETHFANITYTTVAGQWYHYAVTRTGGNITVYVNGVSIYSIASTTNYTGTTVSIGRGANAATTDMQGYISNLRLVKGTAVYTANFTPSTTPLTAISGTQLLTLQDNRFKDNSTNNLTITPTGTPKVQAVSPFSPATSWSAATNGGSMYFGSSNNVTAPLPATLIGSQNYTIEAWVYPTSGTAMQTIASYGSTSWRLLYDSNRVWLLVGGSPLASVTVPGNQWIHVAVTRTGTGTGQGYLHINGVPTAFTDSTTHATGATLSVGSEGASNYMIGYISDFRATYGTALYSSAAFTPPAAPLQPTPSTSLLLSGSNIGALDYTGKNDIVTVGNTQISTVQKKYGTGSMYFDGTGDYLQLPISQNFVYGLGDFTIECWVYATTTTGIRGIMGVGDGAAANPYLFLNGLIPNFYYNNGTKATGPAISANAWVHIAVVKQANVIRIYTNGVSGTPFTDSTTSFTAVGPITVASNSIYGQLYTGYIDDLRVTKGAARYTADFTPPTAKFPTQ